MEAAIARLDRHRQFRILEAFGERLTAISLEEIPEGDVHPLGDGFDGQPNVAEPGSHVVLTQDGRRTDGENDDIVNYREPHRGRKRLQIVVDEKPPSTTMFCPVTNDDARGDANQTMAPANSLRLAETAHWRMADDLPAAFGIAAVGFEKHRSVLLGWEKAGANGVNAHPFCRPFARQPQR